MNLHNQCNLAVIEDFMMQISIFNLKKSYLRKSGLLLVLFTLRKWALLRDYYQTVKSFSSVVHSCRSYLPSKTSFPRLPVCCETGNYLDLHQIRRSIILLANTHHPLCYIPEQKINYLGQLQLRFIEG